MSSQIEQDRLISQIRAFGYSAKRSPTNPNHIDVWSDTVPVGMVWAYFAWGYVHVSARFEDGTVEDFQRDDLGKVMRIAALVARLRSVANA